MTDVPTFLPIDPRQWKSAILYHVDQKMFDEAKEMLETAREIWPNAPYRSMWDNLKWTGEL